VAVFGTVYGTYSGSVWYVLWRCIVHIVAVYGTYSGGVWYNIVAVYGTYCGGV
jgi:hypothetical protein